MKCWICDSPASRELFDRWWCDRCADIVINTPTEELAEAAERVAEAAKREVEDAQPKRNHK